MAKHFLFAIIIHGAFALTVLVHSQDQLGFISIDCGIPEGSSYKDGITEINYISDSTFTDSGVNGNISPEFRINSLEQQLWTVRSFPDGTKNCYTLRPSPGKNRNYLIRVSFMYGNYDAKGKTPTFDLYLGVNRWDTVVVTDGSSNGTPFISVLEVRPLNNNTYIAESGSLDLYGRTIGEIGQQFQLWINKTETSTLQPILNAIEIYTLKQLLQAQTHQEDVDAMKNIKSMYGIKRNWQGDPCVPKDYAWDGLSCSYSGFDPPSITSLNLSSMGLTGVIAPFISNLTMIQYLDLSNNSLNGVIPYFSVTAVTLACSDPFPWNSLKDQIRDHFCSAAVSIFTFIVDASVEGNPNLASVGGNPNPCASSPCKKKKNIVVPVVAAAGGFVILLLCGLALLWHLKRRKKGEVNVVSIGKGRVLESKKQQFTYSEVLRITNNFAIVIGKGGFGTVYHGYLDGFQVAVKMLSPSSAQGYKEFQAEANFLTRVHHKNLTSFVGYCYENTNMGLIYEYMANGNLARHLSGLEYLHNGCQPPIIHRDVKSTNILLDENFQAKLADLGLSRVFPGEGGTHVSTKVVGTPGYLDPEYYASNQLNEKSDVYSFGVVLLEIITGQTAIIKNPEKVHVIQWVSPMLERGDVKNIVDPRLEGDLDINSVWKAIEVAMACVSPTSIERPTMTYVVIELEQCLAMELARRQEGFEIDSGEISGMNQVHSGQTPLAR
uniref:Protein kinase domain-containing protein n=1 Tax=Fagus sylvatica TaxID=28930 RepID=A0A2N9HJ17_FAGSY